MTPRRVLVTGARTWTDTATIRDALAAQWGDGSAVLVTGACPRGADKLAEQCWTAWGGTVERHPADWQRHGRAAGFRRNADLVATGADVCLAFVRGEARGTSHTAGLAADAGIPTHRYQHPEPVARADAERHAVSDPDPSNDDARSQDMSPSNPDPSAPAVAEIAALTARLRDLSSRSATDDERAAFLADKDALLARIPGHTRDLTDHDADRDADREVLTPREEDVGLPERDRDDSHTDADGWFSGGYDAAHQAWLDARGHVDAPSDDAPLEHATPGGLALPSLPAQMLDGIEERRTGPADRDSPAELAARLAQLREQAAAPVGEPVGGWRTVSAEQAARDLAGRGADLGTARAVVGEYLRETSERVGAPAYEWGLDQGDIDAIAVAHQLPAAAARAAADHDGEAARAEQLNRWHVDDRTATDGDAVTADANDVSDDAGWAR